MFLISIHVVCLKELVQLYNATTMTLTLREKYFSRCDVIVTDVIGQCKVTNSQYG